MKNKQKAEVGGMGGEKQGCMDYLDICYYELAMEKINKDFIVKLYYSFIMLYSLKSCKKLICLSQVKITLKVFYEIISVLIVIIYLTKLTSPNGS